MPENRRVNNQCAPINVRAEKMVKDHDFEDPKFPSHKPSSVDYVCLQTEDIETLLPSTYSDN